MKISPGLATTLFFLGTFVILQSTAIAQTTMPSGAVSIYGVSSYSDADIGKQYYLQLYTGSPLTETFVVRFQYNTQGSETWDNIGSLKLVGSLDYLGSKSVRRIIFSPSGIGMKGGVKYNFRAVIYESGSASESGLGKVTYYGGSKTFTQTESQQAPTAPPEVMASDHWSPMIKSQTITASARDDAGISKMEIFVDERSLGSCVLTGPRFAYCSKEYRVSFESTHTYYVKVVGKSGLSTQTAKKSFTVSEADLKSNIVGAKATAIQSDLVIFGYNACAACIKEGKGYNAKTQSCGASSSSSSSTGVSISSGDWIVHERSSETTQVGERSCEGVLADDIRTTQNLPLTGGDNFYVLYRSGGAYTIITEPKGPRGNIVCESCFQEENMGFNTDTQKCERGGPQSSSSKLAGVTKGNWVGVLTEEAKQAFVAISGGYSSIVSCEAYLNKAPTVDKITVIDNVPDADGSIYKASCGSFKSCGQCTPATVNNCGWDNSTGTCKKGTDQGSEDSSASLSKNNWVWYTTESSRGTRSGLSCEKITQKATAVATSGCSSKTSCSACTPDTANSCGWSVKQAKCITGTASGSNDGSSGTGDWTWYTTEATRGSNVGMSCEKAGVSTPAVNPTISNNPSLDSCLACVKLPKKGYASATGKCESGNSTLSYESSANVSAGDWIYYSSDAIMESVVKARPDLYSIGLSCRSKFSPDAACAQVITVACDPSTKQTVAFTTACIPSGWTKDLTKCSSDQQAIGPVTPDGTAKLEQICSAHSVCGACTPSTIESCGWSVKQAKCLYGTSVGSNDKSSSGSDWTWYTSKSSRGAREGLSCEESSVTTVSTGCSSKTSCSACTPKSTDSCGWDKSANACKKGTDQGADDKSASIDKNNWVWYTTEDTRGSKAGMSC